MAKGGTVGHAPRQVPPNSHKFGQKFHVRPALTQVTKYARVRPCVHASIRRDSCHTLVGACTAVAHNHASDDVAIQRMKFLNVMKNEVIIAGLDLVNLINFENFKI